MKLWQGNVVAVAMLLCGCQPMGDSGVTSTLDAGPSSAATSLTCAEVMPALPSDPIDVPYNYYVVPTSDGLGTAAICQIAGSGPYHTECHLISLDGGKVDDVTAFGAGEDSSGALYGTTDHFVWVVANGFGALGVSTVSDTGATLHGTPLRSDFGNQADLVGVGTGGDVWVLSEPGGGSASAVQLDHYDPKLTLVGSAAATSAAFSPLAIGLSTSGDALVAWRAEGTARAKWFDPKLDAKSQEFELSVGSDLSELRMIALADGGMALLATHSDNSVTVVGLVSDGASAAHGAPNWLQDRAGAHFALIRGAKAYAFWPSTPKCLGVEIVALDGTSCGCVPVPDVSDMSNIGADGSLLVPYTHEDGGNYQVGTYWYPALLK